MILVPKGGTSSFSPWIVLGEGSPQCIDVVLESTPAPDPKGNLRGVRRLRMLFHPVVLLGKLEEVARLRPGVVHALLVVKDSSGTF